MLTRASVLDQWDMKDDSLIEVFDTNVLIDEREQTRYFMLMDAEIY